MGTEFKFPDTLGACADLYYTTREKRLAMQREVDEVEALESAVRDHIINNLPKTDNGAIGKICRVAVKVKPKPVVEDWDKFYEFVSKNRKKGGFALLNRAVNAKATQEYWDAGKKVPGVGSMNVVTLSVNKL
jgi:lipid II:glycine glycyltransferase (peptidoglycan interpeptide bridge formation enzyme)